MRLNEYVVAGSPAAEVAAVGNTPPHKSRLGKTQVERFISSSYQSHNQDSVMIKKFFLSRAPVDEFVQI